MQKSCVEFCESVETSIFNTEAFTIRTYYLVTVKIRGIFEKTIHSCGDFSFIA